MIPVQYFGFMDQFPPSVINWDINASSTPMVLSEKLPYTTSKINDSNSRKIEHSEPPSHQNVIFHCDDTIPASLPPRIQVESINTNLESNSYSSQPSKWNCSVFPDEVWEALESKLVHDLRLLTTACKLGAFSQLQPQVAHIISHTRALLTTAGVAKNMTPVLSRYPQLGMKRKMILDALSLLIVQCRSVIRAAREEARVGVYYSAEEPGARVRAGVKQIGESVSELIETIGGFIEMARTLPLASLETNSSNERAQVTSSIRSRPEMQWQISGAGYTRGTLQSPLRYFPSSPSGASNNFERCNNPTCEQVSKQRDLIITQVAAITNFINNSFSNTPASTELTHLTREAVFFIQNLVNISEYVLSAMFKRTYQPKHYQALQDAQEKLCRSAKQLMLLSIDNSSRTANDAYQGNEVALNGKRQDLLVGCANIVQAVTDLVAVMSFCLDNSTESGCETNSVPVSLSHPGRVQIQHRLPKKRSGTFCEKQAGRRPDAVHRSASLDNLIAIKKVHPSICASRAVAITEEGHPRTYLRPRAGSAPHRLGQGPVLRSVPKCIEYSSRQHGWKNEETCNCNTCLRKLTTSQKQVRRVSSRQDLHFPLNNSSTVSLSNVTEANRRGSPVMPGESPLSNVTPSQYARTKSTGEENLPWFVRYKDNRNDIIFSATGQIYAASLESLIEQLTIHEFMPDTNFLNAFMLTFRLFTTPEELCKQLLKRFQIRPPAVDPPLSEEDITLWKKMVRIPVRLRVYNVLKMWLETYWESGDEEVLGRLREWAEMLLKEGMPQSMAERMMNIIWKRYDALSSGYSLACPSIRSLPSSRSSEVSSLSSKDGGGRPSPHLSRQLLTSLRRAPTSEVPLIDFEPLELARQLTILESKIYLALKPRELLAVFAKKADESTAEHVKQIGQTSTKISSWISYSIVSQMDVKKRVSFIKFWIKVGECCLHLNNFSTLMAIVCSLNSSTISRLKLTWDRLPEKYRMALDGLRQTIDHSRNYAEYRNRLKTLVPPCLPYLGLFLTDLTFIHDGNPAYRTMPGTRRQLINFDRHAKTARIIREIQRFQEPYPLEEVTEVQNFLGAALVELVKSDAELYQLSLLVEPRVTTPA
ncbi:uncharacterized protein VTP21DRAFT_1773 [Calcarisporiella thermophila]|uniref:uncharacterized protein n=1 Tax=Calcarisporiella thermophila TaxID=911321 RepID=UPI00374403F1